jgi:hypothetical protein
MAGDFSVGSWRLWETPEEEIGRSNLFLRGPMHHHLGFLGALLVSVGGAGAAFAVRWLLRRFL